MVRHATMPEEDLVRLYLNDVGRHPLLTKADEVVLGRRVQAGLTARGEIDAGEHARARRRELQKTIADGDVATQTSCSRTCVWSSRSPRSTARASTRWTCSTSSRRATSGCSTPWRSSTRTRGSSSPRMQRGGSARRSSAASPRATARCGLPVHAVDQVKLVNRTRSDLATSLGRTPTLEEVADAIGHARREGPRDR